MIATHQPEADKGDSAEKVPTEIERKILSLYLSNNYALAAKLIRSMFPGSTTPKKLKPLLAFCDLLSVNVDSAYDSLRDCLCTCEYQPHVYVLFELAQMLRDFAGGPSCVLPFISATTQRVCGLILGAAESFVRFPADPDR